MPAILAQFPNTHLICAGGGAERARYLELVRTLEQGRKVRRAEQSGY